MAETKIEPRAAMPVAMPIWRNVALVPDAMPAWCGGTTPMAVEASGGLTMPEPSPAMMNPGIRVSDRTIARRHRDHLRAAGAHR